MQRRRTLIKALAVSALLTLTGCSPQITVHGYVPTDEELALIEPGVDTVLTVEDRIGRPSSSGFLRENEWYYVQTTIEQLTYNPPEITDRTVLAITFDEDGVVEAVDRYGLDDGRIVNLNPRVTKTGAQRMNILRRIFGNLFNVSAEQLLGN